MAKKDKKDKSQKDDTQQQQAGQNYSAVEQQLRLLEQQNESLRQNLAKANAEREELEAYRLAFQNSKDGQPEGFVKKPKIRVSYSIMGNSYPVPVIKPADFIQLTPIVQPIPIVPISTTEQPLIHDDNYN